MSQAKQISESLNTCKQYIDQFLKHSNTLDVSKLSANRGLMILAFYEELLALLYDNYNLFEADQSDMIDSEKN
ncbi:hypothetical protein CPT03_09190 [Pedobacter ginsengisoli]|uniref:Uncharacterized protein n=2 Tax=Pedobacter ginsengisoli TaxID=363852 RepID=A0A2D1U4V9_9SPHI|nr:hypothetical protein CPT03_09190 [Pedobacter ginsengisoli]